MNSRVVGRDAADDQEPEEEATGHSCLPPNGSEEEISELLAGIYNFEIDNAGSTEASGSSSTRYNTNSNSNVDRQNLAEEGPGQLASPPCPLFTGDPERRVSARQVPCPGDPAVVVGDPERRFSGRQVPRPHTPDSTHTPTTNDDDYYRSPSDRAVAAGYYQSPAGLRPSIASAKNSICRTAEGQTLGLLISDPQGPRSPSERPLAVVTRNEGTPQAQEERESSGQMGGIEAVPTGCHPGETPSPGGSARLTLVSVRPDRHDTQLVPVRGSVTAVAETGSVLQV